MEVVGTISKTRQASVNLFYNNIYQFTWKKGYANMACHEKPFLFEENMGPQLQVDQNKMLKYQHKHIIVIILVSFVVTGPEQPAVMEMPTLLYTNIF